MAKEEWIWVEGYKGFLNDFSSTYRDFKYEIGKTYTMDKSKIIICHEGFHFGVTLKDVFNYYPWNFSNKFARVKGLVKKSDYDNYSNKMVAAELILLEEVDDQTIFENLPDFYGLIETIDEFKAIKSPQDYQEFVRLKCKAFLPEWLDTDFMYNILNKIRKECILDFMKVLKSIVELDISHDMMLYLIVQFSHEYRYTFNSSNMYFPIK